MTVDIDQRLVHTVIVHNALRNNAMNEYDRLREIRRLLANVDRLRDAYIAVLSTPDAATTEVSKAREIFNDARHDFEREVRIYLTEKGVY